MFDHKLQKMRVSGSDKCIRIQDSIFRLGAAELNDNRHILRPITLRVTK